MTTPTNLLFMADLRRVMLIILIFHILVGAALAPATLSSGSWQVMAGLLVAFLLAGHITSSTTHCA